MLGLGPCYHMVNVLADLEQARLWQRALDGEAPWDELFDGFGSTVDWPGGYFYAELAEAYPDAKVLLSVRDPERWERSMRQTVHAVRHGESLMRLMSSARAHVDPAWKAFLDMIDGLLWQGRGTFAGSHETPEQLIAAMERHHEAVKAAIPPERLLVWEVAQGWEPLCEFLELPVPDQPFPHVNDSEEFVDRIIDGSLQVLNEWRAREAPVAAATKPPPGSAVDRDRAALPSLDAFGRRVQELMREVGEGTGGRELLADDRDVRVLRAALGLAPAVEALVAQLEDRVRPGPAVVVLGEGDADLPDVIGHGSLLRVHAGWSRRRP
jgi:hypothetical protein